MSLLHKLELKLPPLPLMFIVAALMFFLAHKIDTSLAATLSHWRSGLSITLTGIVVMMGSVWQFRRAKTTLNPFEPNKASQLVSTGLFGLSRNPIYLGMLLILIGWAICLWSPLPAIGVPLFALYMTRFQIMPEERILLELFGAPYRDYMARVRRWI